MNPEFEELIASFRVAEDLEHAVQSTIQGRMEEFNATPMTGLPISEEELVEEPQSLRIKRVNSRVIERLKAA